MVELRLDESAWDAGRAMGACSSASDYRSICAGEKTVGEPDERQHWALPHHYLGQEANAAGVRAARARFGQTQGLKNREEARTHLFDTHKLPSDQGQAGRPPRENLVRALAPGALTTRANDEDPDGPPIMFGRFAHFDEWTEIDSMFEGHFLERFKAGSFKKTLREFPPKPMFQHGADHELSDRVIGVPTVLHEDDRGPYFEVELFRSVPQLVLDGLEAGSYGMSFRFGVIRETFDREPPKSAHNPDGLPERTVLEARVPEFSPVTFPAYDGPTVGLRSITDEIIFGRFTQDPARLSELIEYVRSRQRADEDSADDESTEQESGEQPDEESEQEGAPSDPTPTDEVTSGERRVPLFGEQKEDRPAWML